MLFLEIPKRELFNEETSQLIYIDPITLKLEHSLISISKWEAKHKKPFLNNKDITSEETLDYIKCMCLTPNVPDEVFNYLSRSEIEKIIAYIQDPMTATWFGDSKGEPGYRPNREIITSELIYYWMISYQIPSEYQKWHISRLLTLIKVCERKNQNPKKMNKRSILQQNTNLNAIRRAKMNSKG